MRANQTTPRNIDEYIAGFPPDVQKILERVRLTIRRAAPKAEEAIKYRIPAFTLKGNLVYFAAHKNHVGIYPVPKGTKEFQKEISDYKAGKGTIRFPLDRPIPLDLLGKIIKFRVKENLEKAEAKGKKR
jgi:uncharacterized protein YdhG (YjbR/CyaY superfamily)